MCGAVKVSVESVVESLVSRYESHFDKNRTLDEKNAMDEMQRTDPQNSKPIWY